MFTIPAIDNLVVLAAVLGVKIDDILVVDEQVQVQISGLIYKELGLKDKLETMSEEEQLQLLATNGMLVKRPLVVGDDFVLTGFREKEWEVKLK